MKRKVTKQNRAVNDKGFSLLEVILSMAILAIISIPLLMYFVDSIRYSALMEKKQQATVLAQAVVEDLKAQDRLIVKPEGETGYTVPYLTDPALGYAIQQNNLLADGTGNISLLHTNENYDVEITLSTDTAANDNTRPVIYGIDDTTDVLSVEHNQLNEALAYFVAVNNAYVVANPSAASLSQAEIKNDMTRQIQIEITPYATEYGVCIYYDYTCENLRGTGSVDTWRTSNLLDIKIAELKNIYLLFDQDTSSSARDSIKVSNVSATPLSSYPELYLICQNPANNSGYRLSVELLDVSQVIHTNIRDGFGQVTYADGTINTNTKELTSNTKPVRLIKIKTEIYPKGHSATDEPYAVFETTKGE